MSKRHLFTVVLVAALLLTFGSAAQTPPSNQEALAGAPTGCLGILPTPPINAQSSEITALSPLSTTDVWAVGNTHTTEPSDHSDGFSMHYNGTDWQIISTDAITQSYTLQDIAATSPNDAWAVGSYDNGSTASNPGIGRLVLHWNGKTWGASLKGATGELNAVSATSSGDVWAVGDAGGPGIVHHWNGHAWTETPINSYALRDVVALAPDDVWIAGSASPAGASVYHWDGERWSATNSPILDAYGLLALDHNNVWVIGSRTYQPETFHWDGTTWTEAPSSYSIDAQLNAAAAYAPDDIWAAGTLASNALLAHWDGTTWSGIPNPVPGFQSGLNDIVRVGDELWAGGSRVVRSSGDADAAIARYTTSPCPAPGPSGPLNPPVPVPGSESLPFATGKSINGVFLKYWQDHGGLQQQGYPITDAIGEISDLDGKVYTMQYFERAVFEYHPEHRGTPYEVLLSQLGTFQYAQKYPDGAPNQRPNQDAGTLYFPETGKRLGGSLLQYWQQHGGLAQQGYPISDEFTEVSDTDGKPYTVQYFERAVFEWHPENPPPYNVLLSLLGNFRYNDKYLSKPTSPPSSQPRVISGDIGGGLMGGGHYLFWHDAPNSGSNVNLFRAYNAQQNMQFSVGGGDNRPMSFPAAADSKRAIWRVNSDLFELFDFGTGATFTVNVPAGSSSPTPNINELALDDNTLYYITSDSLGYRVISQDLIRQEDKVVTTSKNPLSNLWERDGIAMWLETVAATPREQALHVWNASARSEFVPAQGIGAFTGFGASGDYLVWSFYTTISDQATYLLDTRTGARKVLNSGAASKPIIASNKVAWIQWPDPAKGETGGWNIEIYNVETGKTTTAVANLPAMPQDLMLLDGDKLAFTADTDISANGSELFIVDLAP